ncbi:MAG: hypothetical protein JST00_47295 [Deltaproteobacteria bacterium]|nr:hypothetical protein [Deltaproteobacteria bacterium]
MSSRASRLRRYRRPFHLSSVVQILFLALSIAACGRRPPSPLDSPSGRTSPAVQAAGGQGAPMSPEAAGVSRPVSVAPKPATSGPAHGAFAADDHTIGAPTQVFRNLVVYPVTSKTQVDVGPLLALDDALAKGLAEVRETGGGGSVNTLVIENKGPTPIFVIAGTIVKGGNQDRQIGQDFIIEAKQTTPVDAFCVEHGRWNGNRDGRGTAGKFGTSEVVATSKIRAAGQYKKSQGEVWSNVSESNTANGQRPSSDTFLASVDDVAIAKQRAELAAKIDGVLGGVKADELVGVAYAIDGEIRGVRWFAHHAVFELVRKKLVHGIALEAITTHAQMEARGQKPSDKPAPAPAQVDEFVKSVEAQQVTEQRDTAAANVNEYKESGQGYGSKTMFKGAGKAGSSPRKPVSSDFVKK